MNEPKRNDTPLPGSVDLYVLVAGMAAEVHHTRVQLEEVLTVLRGMNQSQKDNSKRLEDVEADVAQLRRQKHSNGATLEE